VGRVRATLVSSLLKPDLVAAVFVLGVLFAVLAIVNKSLWSAIMAHGINDLLSVIVFTGS